MQFAHFQFDPETEFLKWSQVVCRFEALKCRRRKARDRHVFSEDLLELSVGELRELTRTHGSPTRPAALS